MSAHPEQLALSIILEKLFIEGVEAARRAAGVGGSLRAVSGRYQSISRADINNLPWMQSKDSFRPNQVIYLTPPDGRSIAALWYRWNFDPGRISMCKFYYGVWRMIDPHPRGAAAHITRVPAFFGYRFEPPEVQGTDHGYYHSQPCRSMGPKDQPDPFALDIDDKGPTWPLAATNAIDLLLCVYMALYGARRFIMFKNELLNERRVQRNAELIDALARISGLAKR